MSNFPSLRFGPDYCSRYGLPEIDFPLRPQALKQAVGNEGTLPFSELLFGLQEASAEGKADWQALEAPMGRLAELIAPYDEREQVVAAGDNWWLEVGPVNLGGKVVTIQRGEDLLAAMAPREDGRLRVGAYRPLDSKSLGYLCRLAVIPHPEHGVCMRENNWEYALDSSGGIGNHYAAERGEAYLSFWEFGVGVSADGSDVPGWREQQELRARRPAVVATELGVHYVLASEQNEVDSDVRSE